MQREPWMSDEGFAGAQRVEQQEQRTRETQRLQAKQLVASRTFVLLIALLGFVAVAGLRSYWEPWYSLMHEEKPWLLYGVILPLPPVVALFVMQRLLRR